MWCIRNKTKLLLLALGMVLASLVVIARFGIPFGIDFTGGALTEVVYETAPTQAEVETTLNPLGLGAYSLRETGTDDGKTGFIVRTRDLDEAERVTVNEALTALGEGVSVERFTSIGPVIGQELSSKAVWAIVGVSLVIILYVAFAFAGVSYPVGSWVYGGITIVALLHDVIIPTAVMVLLGVFLGVEADVLFIMALLAVLGYSVNDTIVVFDRVRENLKDNREEKKVKVIATDGLEREEVEYTLTKPFGDIVGMSINQTLVRSLNTSITTVLALFALYFFGGEVTKTFTLILIAGVVAGTYSSICVANPLLVAYAEWKAKKTS